MTITASLTSASVRHRHVAPRKNWTRAGRTWVQWCKEERMVLISVTRLRLRSLRFVPPFVLHALRSTRQTECAAGFLAGQLAPEPLLGFWTITAWSDEAAMRAYRNANPHLRAMRKLLDWCDEASVVHWEQADAALPSAEEARRRLLAEGHLSKVTHPSPAQSARRLTAGTPKPGRPLRPTGTRA